MVQWKSHKPRASRARWVPGHPEKKQIGFGCGTVTGGQQDPVPVLDRFSGSTFGTSIAPKQNICGSDPASRLLL